MGDLLPGGSFRRIEGRPEQANVPVQNPDQMDPDQRAAYESRRVNDGSPVGATLTIPGRDALLVVRTTAAP